MTQITASVRHSASVPAERWSAAWHRSLYGPGGWFLTSLPLQHFRTAVANPLYAEAVRALASRVDAALGRPDPFDLVDVGAGGGELLQAMARDVPARWRLTGVDLRPRPAALAAGIGWLADIPSVTGLLLANEWLDSVPLDVLADGRVVLVDTHGREEPGPLANGAEQAWAARWWPGGDRVEVGLTRDLAWSAAVGQVRRGLAVAVDYGHVLDRRRPTLTGYRDGRQVPPVPDGRGDLTAHVALDSCAAATGAQLLLQADVLARLGILARLPLPTDPSYTEALVRASQAHELLDPAGLGGFGWLVQSVGLPAGSMRW